MREFIEIGSTPPEEDCAQVGSPDYHQRGKKECFAYINLLRRHLGEEPKGASLRVKSHRHDFGTYHEVVCYFDTDNDEAADYAYRCEGEGPEKWDELALKELNLASLE